MTHRSGNSLGMIPAGIRYPRREARENRPGEEAIGPDDQDCRAAGGRRGEGHHRREARSAARNTGGRRLGSTERNPARRNPKCFSLSQDDLMRYDNGRRGSSRE